MTLTQRQVGLTFVLFIACALLATQPALAADIFASGKTAIKESAGKGSMVETAMLGSGLILGTITGFTTRNWVAGVGGFVGGNILWAVGAPLVGLA
ncbi:type IV conjugative transfer system pilin TraA (plasmid) [Vibrio tubiashii]|uniref:type IV conjugative transfer system pilin TraA n=1 Tax=Vibrio tubiashii TaxID=29498 RepID=UPI003CE44A0E